MRNLIGLELTCFGRSEHFEMTYEGGTYYDPKGAPVDDVMDMTCYVCSAAYYTRQGDAIAYCPNCGHVDRKRFDRREDLVEFMRGQDLSWLKVPGLQAAAAQTFEGDWRLVFARDPDALAAQGRFRAIRSL
ncbi:MAG: hypothetical protein ACQEXJ_05130 [Myxococcota bacterium]